LESNGMIDFQHFAPLDLDVVGFSSIGITWKKNGKIDREVDIFLALRNSNDSYKFIKIGKIQFLQESKSSHKDPFINLSRILKITTPEFVDFVRKL
jgi:hypothetical protein